MAWTDQRIATLRQMWLEGHSATSIAGKLGNVSRNAVIGKAHRIGLPPRHQVMAKLLMGVEELPISRRTKNVIRQENVIYVGDVVQRTEAEWLRIPLFGRKSLQELNAALRALDLRLGMEVVDWPPEQIEREEADKVSKNIYEETAQKIARLEQTPGGAIFEPVGNQFAMAKLGDDDDEAAARRPLNQQMQEMLLERARQFKSLALRLDNQPGWNGIGRTVSSLIDLLDRDPENIPAILGYLYPTAIELGSFIEFDQQLHSGLDSNALPLDPEVRRPLSDLVRNLAPWLRAFPSVRDLDEEANRFLVKITDLDSTFDVVDAAKRESLLPDRDLEFFQHLRDAVERGEFIGEKGGGHAKRSAKNLLICAAAFLGTIYAGAVSSEVATASPLAQKAGQFIVSVEQSATDLLSELPYDLRHALAEFIEHFPTEFPLIIPTPRRWCGDPKRKMSNLK